MKPRAGLGVDRLTPMDVQRLPLSARAELVDFYNQVEDQLTWPWQLLIVEGRLLPKKAQGDRVIGILCMVCRIWSMIREDIMKPWTIDSSESWDAALAGNAALREAFLKTCLLYTSDAADDTPC
eukprot:1809726-Pyramimonas_sp.AAC.1